MIMRDYKFPHCEPDRFAISPRDVFAHARAAGHAVHAQSFAVLRQVSHLVEALASELACRSKHLRCLAAKQKRRD